MWRKTLWHQEDACPLLFQEVWRQGDLEKAKDRRRSLQGGPMCYKLFQYPKHLDQKISHSISGMFLLGFWDRGALHHRQSKAFWKGKQYFIWFAVSNHDSSLEHSRVTMLLLEPLEGRTPRCWRISWRPWTTAMIMDSSWFSCQSTRVSQVSQTWTKLQIVCKFYTVLIHLPGQQATGTTPWKQWRGTAISMGSPSKFSPTKISTDGPWTRLWLRLDIIGFGGNHLLTSRSVWRTTAHSVESSGARHLTVVLCRLNTENWSKV